MQKISKQKSHRDSKKGVPQIWTKNLPNDMTLHNKFNKKMDQEKIEKNQPENLQEDLAPKSTQNNGVLQFLIQK